MISARVSPRPTKSFVVQKPEWKRTSWRELHVVLRQEPLKVARGRGHGCGLLDVCEISQRHGKRGEIQKAKEHREAVGREASRTKGLRAERHMQTKRGSR